MRRRASTSPDSRIVSEPPRPTSDPAGIMRQISRTASALLSQ